MQIIIPTCVMLAMISFPFLIIESKVRSRSACVWSVIFSISAAVLIIAMIATMKNMQ